MTGLPAGYGEAADHPDDGRPDISDEDFDDDQVDHDLIDAPDGRQAIDDEAADGDAPQLVFGSVNRFVVDHLAPMYRRRIGATYAWCPEWWRHAEAAARLEALWLAWEYFRLESPPTTGMSVWFRDHADPHMGVLLSPDGPFKGCSPDDGHDPHTPPLPCIEPPPGLYDDEKSTP